MTPTPPPTSKGKFVVIDGNSLLYRAFYALPPMQTRRGEHTNAIYGFMNMLLRLLDQEQPAYLAVAFDPPKPSFRIRIDPAYKAHREKTPPELGEQIQRTRQVLAALQIPVFEVSDFEADDVIGTLAHLFARADHQVTVVSGDADLLQLVEDQILVMLTKKGISQMESYDPQTLAEQYGLTAKQFIDYKALKGDPSDNIPGVPGIGDKTARSLLTKYGSLEAIYDHLDELKGKIAENLKIYRDQLFTGRELVTIRRDVPLDLDLEECLFREPDYEELLPLLEDLEFKSLAARIGPEQKELYAAQQEGSASKPLPNLKTLQDMLKALPPETTIAINFEYEEGRPYWRQALRGVGLATQGDTCYHLGADDLTVIEPALLKSLKAFQEQGGRLIVHNLKLWLHRLIDHGLTPAALPTTLFDLQLAAYLVDPARGGYDLPNLLQQHCAYSREVSVSRKKEQLPVVPPGPQLGREAGLMFQLFDQLSIELKDQSLEPLYHDLEAPLAAVLCRIERVGLKIDDDYLYDLSAEIRRRIGELERQIYTLAGEEFNLNSSQQLAVILFDNLKLPVIRKTKTGRSTDVRVLEELALHHEIAEHLIHYRQLAKLEGTYLTGLAEMIDPVSGKIYTTLNQVATATGRLSSSDPNLQNIPIRLEEGRRIRRAFIPSEPGKILFAADYSQVELRILAHLSEDPILIEAFNTGQDIHRRTAAEVNNIDLAAVTPLMREKAKAVNFGIIYGSSDFGLSQGLKIPRAEAKAYIDSYFERYQGVKRYMDQIVAQAKDQGFVTTILKRRRYLPEINAANFNIRSFAERMALNTPIQGSAADLIKLAMLRVDKIIAAGGFNAVMLLQIHDELLFEVDQNELTFFAPMIQREMEQAYQLSVPLKVDLKWGANWEELKQF